MPVGVSESVTQVNVTEDVNVVEVLTLGVPLLPPGGTVGQIPVRTATGYSWEFLLVESATPPAQGDFPGQMWVPAP